MLKNLFFISSITYTNFLAIVCLITLNKVPKVGISFADKIFHCFAYMVLSSLWYITLTYRFKFKRKGALIYASGFSILFGIIIEVLQGTLTTSRAFDVYDVVANTIGVLLTVIFVSVNKNITIKN